jgi:hypothetical protein
MGRSESLELGRKSPDLCLLAFYVFFRSLRSVFMIVEKESELFPLALIARGASNHSACWLDENKNKFLIAFYDVLPMTRIIFLFIITSKYRLL